MGDVKMKGANTYARSYSLMQTNQGEAVSWAFSSFKFYFCLENIVCDILKLVRLREKKYFVAFIGFMDFSPSYSKQKICLFNKIYY